MFNRFVEQHAQSLPAYFMQHGAKVKIAAAAPRGAHANVLIIAAQSLFMNE